MDRISKQWSPRFLTAGSSRGGRAPVGYGALTAVFVLLFTVASTFSALTLTWGINPHDEGLMLQWAGRVADGQLPYRDFWCNYGPAQPLLLGAAVKLFGPSLLVWRLMRAVVGGVVALLAYLLLREVAGPRVALLVWFAVALAAAFPATPGPNLLALMFALSAFLAVRRAPFCAGVLVGIATLFRFEIGFAVAVGLATSVVLTEAVGFSGSSRVSRLGPLESTVRPKRGNLAVGRILTGSVAMTLLGLLPFLFLAPKQLFDQTVGFVAIQDLQRLPFPLSYSGPFDPNKLLEFYFPLILVLATVFYLMALLLGRGCRRVALPLLPLTLTGSLYLLGRTDEFHLLPLSVVLAVGLGLVAGAAVNRVISTVALVFLASIAVHGIDRLGGQLVHPPALTGLVLPVADGVKAPAGEARDLQRTVAFIDRRLPGGSDPIFVANPRHDLVGVGNPLFYVLAQRSNPTRYDVMQPGVVTSRSVQEEIVDDLKRAQIELVVRWSGKGAVSEEPNGSSRSSGVWILDRYIDLNFKTTARFGYYEVLEVVR